MSEQSETKSLQSTDPGTKKKAHIVDLTRSYPFSDLQDTFTARGSYMNALSLLRAVNRHLELTPEDYVFPKVYKTRAEDICHFILEKYQLPTPAAKKSKILAFSSIYTRILWKDAKNPYRIFADKILHNRVLLPVKPIPEPDPAPDWNVVLPLLERFSHESRARGTTYITALICTLYKHGFVLRTEQIFHTCLRDLDDDTNWMDLESKVYHIRSQKNKERSDVVIPDGLVEDLKATLAPDQTWLIETKAGRPYANALNPPDYRWPALLPNCRGCRASFRTWLKTQGSAVDEPYWCRVLGHSQQTAENYYVRPQEVS